MSYPPRIIAGMCFLCDGGTPDELRREIEAEIDQRRPFVVDVERTVLEPAWSYTIGLSELFDHPELVMVASCATCAAEHLDALVKRIAAGRRFDGEQRKPVKIGRDREARFGPVHPDQWDTGRLAFWNEYYDAKPWESPPQRALQVLFVVEGGFWQDDWRNIDWPGDRLDRPRRFEVASMN